MTDKEPVIPDEATKRYPPRMLSLSILDNDNSPHEIIASVLMVAFNKSIMESQDMATSVKEEGAAEVGIYPLDVMETKIFYANDIVSYTEFQLIFKLEAVS